MLDTVFDVLLWFLPRKVHWVIVALILLLGLLVVGVSVLY